MIGEEMNKHKVLITVESESVMNAVVDELCLRVERSVAETGDCPVVEVLGGGDLVQLVSVVECPPPVTGRRVRPDPAHHLSLELEREED